MSVMWCIKNYCIFQQIAERRVGSRSGSLYKSYGSGTVYLQGGGVPYLPTDTICEKKILKRGRVRRGVNGKKRRIKKRNSKR
jgi:hypothetical protein